MASRRWHSAYSMLLLGIAALALTHNITRSVYIYEYTYPDLFLLDRSKQSRTLAHTTIRVLDAFCSPVAEYILDGSVHGCLLFMAHVTCRIVLLWLLLFCCSQPSELLVSLYCSHHLSNISQWYADEFIVVFRIIKNRLSEFTSGDRIDTRRQASIPKIPFRNVIGLGHLCLMER